MKLNRVVLERILLLVEYDPYELLETFMNAPGDYGVQIKKLFELNKDDSEFCVRSEA